MARMRRVGNDVIAYLGIATSYRGDARIRYGMAVVLVVGVVNLLWTRVALSCLWKRVSMYGGLA